jgi:hypothetical protein
MFSPHLQVGEDLKNKAERQLAEDVKMNSLSLKEKE